MKKRESKRAKNIWRVIILGLIIIAIFTAITAVITDRIMSSRIITAMKAELEANVLYEKIDDAEIAYRRLGNGEESLLLIHGFMGSSYDFHLIMPALAEHYTVYAVDQIGFGLSDKSPDLDFSKTNSAVLIGKLMDQLGVVRYHLLGHSMGGEVAMHIALNRPESVDRLILLNSAGLGDLQNGRRTRLPAWMIDNILQNYLLQRLVFLRTVYDNSFADANNFARFYYFNKQIPATALNRIIEDNDSGILGERIAEIENPALLIWGRQDRIIPLDQGRELARLLPDSRLVIFEECGHLPYLEKPEEMASEIIRFLGE